MESSWYRASSLQSNEAIYFCDYPDFSSQKSLHAVVAISTIKKLERVTSVQPSCCRELIFTETDILISPQIEFPDQIIIILKKEMFYSDRFKKKLESLSLEMQEEIDVTPELFQYCFLFTLTHRLAPFWNKIGEYMVQGKGFLEDRGKLNAIRLGVKVSNKIFFSITACQMKLPPCQIEDFSISPNILGGFRESRYSVIKDTSIDNNRCLVIPSLKKAFICSISRQIPKSSPFQTYEELRKHWKLMYGYHLPSKSCEEYYNVRFHGETTFTYPSYCIRSDEPIIFNRCDHESIQATFLRDLGHRMPTVCGTPIVLSRTPLFQEVKLCRATAEKESFLLQKPKSKIPAPRVKPQPFIKATESADVIPPKNGFDKPVLDDKTRLIPSFTKRKIQPPNLNKQGDVCQKEKKIATTSTVAMEVRCPSDKGKAEPPKVLKFAARRSLCPTDKGKNRQQNATKSSASLPIERPCPKSKTAQGKPRKFPVAARTLSTSDKSKNKQQNVPKSSASKGRSCLSENAEPEKQSILNSTAVAENLCPFDIDMNGSEQRKVLKSYVMPRQPTATPERPRSSIALSLANQILQNCSELDLDDDDFQEPGAVGKHHDVQTSTSTVPMQNVNAQSSDSIKDCIGQDVQKPPAKKPRSKPIVTEITDMADIVRKNELKKTNVASIKAWLKMKGIQFKTNTKKEELIELVKNCVTCQMVEE